MKHKPLITSTLLVVTASTLLRSLGFIREMVLATVYGAGVVTDAFVIAYNIPATVLAFIGSAMASVYIPLYQSNKERKNLFTSNIVSLLALVGLAFSLVFTFCPQALVYLFASRIDAETFELAAMLVRLMIWSAIPILLAEIFRGYLQTQSVFFRSLAAGAFVNICVIAAIIFSGATHTLYMMGIGAVAGNIFSLAALVLLGKKYELRYRPYLNLRDQSVKELLVLIAPIIAATSIGELNQIIDRNFASSLTTGAISSLNYANKLIGLITALIGAALGTVLFPKMSEFAAEDNYASLKKYLMGCIKKLTPILLPMTAGVMILAEPVVRLLFERGAFTAGDTRRTAECLQMYAICFTGGSINALIVRAFYAIKNTRAPAAVSALAVCVNIALNFLLIGPLQHRGLALATGIATTVSMLLLTVLLRRSLGALGLTSELRELAKTTLATLIMAAAVWVGNRYLPVMTGSALQGAAWTACLVLSGAALYLTAHAVLRTAFIRDAKAIVSGLLRR